ncbi:glycosyltransferase family protein [Helicobacter ibis]|uniref:Glycosyltransferase n=1 Tax=Helicobacter ibis TaxID=2962633 RepID=A0ABT4VGB0_9HELI|nr:hypothetical protein [Helicobacter ibis]MDA3969145.1 hypothetical protein [Helicobacter ibis]
MELQEEEIIKRLQESQSKKDLNNVCMLLRAFGKGWQENLETPLKEQIAQLLQDKSYEIIFKGGDVPDRTILWAYGIFDCARDDERFLSYVDFCKPYIRDTSLSYYERLLFIDYASVAIMLSGDREGAVKFFLENIMFLTLNDYYIADLNDFVLTFLYYYYIPIEWILEIQRKNLSDEVYFSLDNTTRRSIFLWSMHCFWNTRHYFNNLKWRDNYPVWLEVLRGLLERNELDEAMYVEFYIYHKFGNSAQIDEDWEEYNASVVKLVEPYFVEYGKKLPKCKDDICIEENRKIKIGILEDRIVGNSPYKVEYSLYKALMGSDEFVSKYELVVYSMSYIQKSADGKVEIESIRDLGVKVVSLSDILLKEGYYYSHLNKALTIRNYIFQDGIDILISTGTIDCSDFLFCTRSAPRQIYWSHGNGSYDIFGIDDRISHFNPRSKEFKFEQFFIPMDRDKFYNPQIDESLIIKEKAKYPIKNDTVVLGVIGRLVKVDSEEYLETIAKILKENQNTIFIAAGNGNEPDIRKKVEALGVSDRFFMPGFVNPHVYGHIIDIFCNTFPLDQGESFSEFLAKRGAFLNLLNRECTFSGKLRELKLGKKVLVYCDNLEEFKPNVCGFDEFIKTDCIFVTNKKLKVCDDIRDRVYVADISNEDMELLGDYKIHVVGDCFEHLGGNFVCEKELIWCVYHAKNLRWWKEMADNIQEYYIDGSYIGWCCSAFSKEQYIKKAKFLIENKKARDKLGEFYGKHGVLQTNKFQQELIKKFTQIIRG